MNRTFEHFPQDSNHKCPICGTNEDKECFLLPLDGTAEGRTEQAAPTHVVCITENLGQFRFSQDMGLIYTRSKETT